MKKFGKSALLMSVIVLAGFIFSVNIASAHRDGCHRWHSCPSDTGSYVCGDLGYYSECPSSKPAVQTPKAAPKVVAPRTPVLTKKTLTVDEAIPHQSQIKSTGKEYKGYKKVTQQGVHGVQRNYYEVTYTDGKETGRALVKTEAVTEPVANITLEGKRIKPKASFSAIKKTKKKDKYDISGKYASNKEVVLAVKGKKIKRAKTDKNGKFTFKGIKITEDGADLKLYKRENRKENQISEKTFINLSKKSLKTEYAKMHEK